LSQQLLFRREIELTHSQVALFEVYQENLNGVGFVTQLSNNKIVITGAPAICSGKQLKHLFEDIFASTEKEIPFESFSQADFISKVIAKSLSIKSGKSLSIIEQQSLVDDLFACKETLLSPFDRQIFVTLDKEELENKLN
jgi:DNA mismatch repair protein MutL